MNFTTIILAGGQSRRMGANKALVPYFGKPLIQYSIDLAVACESEILISANNHDLDYLEYPVVNDILAVKAPLAGIHAGLKSSRSGWNLVLTCDMPNVTRALIDQLLSLADDNFRIILPHHNGFLEPLCGFYHRDLIPVIENNFMAGKLSLLDLPGCVPHRFLSMADVAQEKTDLLFRNVNEKKDLLF